MTQAKPTVVSLFSGCGGLDLGFCESGFEVLYAADNDPAAVACYGANIGSHVVRRDVSEPAFLADLRQIGHCDVVLGGFPCQGFSKAGPKRVEDSRNTLYLQMQQAVSQLRPAIFVAENVDGIQQNFGGEFVDRITLGFHPYQVQFHILDAAEFGVPQHRRRAFFVGIREDIDADFAWPAPTHRRTRRNGEFALPGPTSCDLPAPLTVAEAISDLVSLDGSIPDHQTRPWPQKYQHIFEAIGPGQKLCNVRHADTSVYTWNIPKAFGETSAMQRSILETIAKNRRHKRYGRIPNGNPIPADEIARLLKVPSVADHMGALLDAGYVKRRNGGFDLKGAMFNSGLFKRMAWNEPSVTVLTNFYNPRYFVHPLEDRPFSLRECARLQTFPDGFEFTNTGISLVDGYKLVGNAVPPALSRALAGAVSKLLDGRASPL